jgi:hypothetical protein
MRLLRGGKSEYIYLSASRPLDEDGSDYCSGHAQGYAMAMLSDMFDRRVELDVRVRLTLVDHPSGLDGCSVDALVAKVTPELPVASFVFKTRGASAHIICLADAAAICDEVADTIRISRR